ncbi:hypothetical protein IW262DRAFT_1291955 [Armillaria fumosa]|nr:hypothetical protein IW262DRAFT_1291955 [Armillaria fumosa]
MRIDSADPLDLVIDRFNSLAKLPLLDLSSAGTLTTLDWPSSRESRHNGTAFFASIRHFKEDSLHFQMPSIMVTVTDGCRFVKVQWRTATSAKRTNEALKPHVVDLKLVNRKRKEGATLDSPPSGRMSKVNTTAPRTIGLIVIAQKSSPPRKLSTPATTIHPIQYAVCHLLNLSAPSPEFEPTPGRPRPRKPGPYSVLSFSDGLADVGVANPPIAREIKWGCRRVDVIGLSARENAELDDTGTIPQPDKSAMKEADWDPALVLSSSMAIRSLGLKALHQAKNRVRKISHSLCEHRVMTIAYECEVSGTATYIIKGGFQQPLAKADRNREPQRGVVAWWCIRKDDVDKYSYESCGGAKKEKKESADGVVIALQNANRRQGVMKIPSKTGHAPHGETDEEDRRDNEEEQPVMNERSSFHGAKQKADVEILAE